MATRRPSSIEYEGFRAMLALAGVRQLKQSSVAPGAGANSAYTVTEAGTRRVVAIHLGTGAGDIRFNHDAVADATKIPVIPQRYFVVDAEKDDTLNFFNTSGGAITVYVMEID